jgi:hypothetical protein
MNLDAWSENERSKVGQRHKTWAGYSRIMQIIVDATFDEMMS